MQSADPGRPRAIDSAGLPVWIGLHFPSLALDVCTFDRGLPAVVLDQPGGQQRVHAACPAAIDHGIAPGMSLNAAHALCRNLSIRLRDPAAEYRRLCARADRLRVFTPHVTPGKWRSAASECPVSRRRGGSLLLANQVSGPADNADSLLLEVSGSLRLFGGLEPIVERIRAEFSIHASAPLLSIAPCPSAALLLARNGIEIDQDTLLDASRLRAVLGDIPLTAVDITPKLLARLERCGLHQLRDLWRLPRKDLGRRFGADLLTYLDRLANQQPEPVARNRPAPRFRQRMALPVDTRSNKLILIAAERLLAEARRFLELQAAATEQIRFDLWHVNRAYGSRSRTTLMVRSGRADRTPARFLPQFEEQLGRLVIEQPVDAVSILVDQIMPLQRASEDLFSRRDQHSEDWSQLMDLLIARLGQDRVYTLAASADHRPERAWQQHEINDGDHDDREIAETLDHMAPRPLWLLDQPRPLSRNAVQPRGELERIEAGWWERRDIRRDYCVAEGSSPNDGWGWVYRNRRDQGEDCEQGWHLHGLFG